MILTSKNNVSKYEKVQNKKSGVMKTGSTYKSHQYINNNYKTFSSLIIL